MNKPKIYTAPKKYDMKVGKAVRKTVIFETAYFSIGGKDYHVLGTRINEQGEQYLIENEATREYKWIDGTTVRSWINN